MAHRTRRPDKRRHYSNASPMRMAGESDQATPLEIAMNRAAKLLPAERAEVIKEAWAGFEAFRFGLGNLDHWAHLVDAINIAVVLAHRQIASDHKHTFEAAREVLRDVHDRQATTGSWTLRGPEIADLELALFVHKVQLEHCSRGELAFAVKTVIDRVRQALAGNAAPGTHVCMPGHLATTTPRAAAEGVSA